MGRWVFWCFIVELKNDAEEEEEVNEGDSEGDKAAEDER